MNTRDLDLAELKSRWNEILDEVERKNRIVWLIYFDARLVSLDGGKLKISFADSEKFSGAHDFSAARKEANALVLSEAIFAIMGRSVVIEVA